MAQWQEVETWLAEGQGQRVAWLTGRASARHIAETLAALANAEGGTLLIMGGSQAEASVGLGQIEATLDRVREAISLCEPRLILPLPDVVRANRAADGAAPPSVIVLAVPPGLAHVYSVAGHYVQRVGRENRPLTTARLRQLLIRRGELSYDSQEAQGATANDLDWSRVRQYGERVGLIPPLSPEETLRQRGGLSPRSNCPTWAGLLLFGRAPERLLHGSEIIAVHYPTTEMGDRFVREDIRGPLPDQIQRANAFVMAHMRRGMLLSGVERIERCEYPPEAVREAIVNAVAHRDYSITGDGIRLLMFANRIEIDSPGKLPGHVTVDNILDERYSRNEIIVQVLSDLGYIERLGYGVNRMVALLHAEGLPAPTFSETANGFRVVLWGHGDKLAPLSAARGGGVQAGMNPRQELALHYLEEHERITNREYQTLCPEASPETLRRDLAELVQRGILLRIGDKRATYYVLR